MGGSDGGTRYALLARASAALTIRTAGRAAALAPSAIAHFRKEAKESSNAARAPPLEEKWADRRDEDWTGTVSEEPNHLCRGADT